MKQTRSVICTIMISFFAFNALHAQVGLRAEGIFSKVNGDDVFTKSLTATGTTNINFQFGYGGALTLQIPLGSHFSLQPEVHYSQQGFKVTSSTGDTSLIGKISVDAGLVTQYINVPLLLKLNVGSREHTHLYLIAGPYLGYALSGTTNSSTTISGQSTTSSSPYDFIKNNYNRLDYGVTGGLGVGFRVGGGTLTLDGRYTQGLGNLQNSSSTTTTTTTSGKVYNQSLSIGLGYVFGF